MRPERTSLLALLIVAGLALTQPAEALLVDQLKDCGLSEGESGFVTDVVDGDTVRLKSGRQVRLVGIQAPKLPLGRQDFKAWPLGDEAKAALQSLVLRRQVQLYYGGAREDRHGRILAHLVVEADDRRIWIEADLLERGLARVYSFADNRSCVNEMLAVEGVAREEKHGIWGNRWYAIRSHDETERFTGSFQLVEGRVLDVAEVRTGVYLNFEENWREDFTIFVPKRDLKRLGGAQTLLLLEGSRVRVRGWLKFRNGPIIDVSHPEQIERLENAAF